MANMTTQEILQGVKDWTTRKLNNNDAKNGYYVCSTNANVAAKTISATNYVLGNGGSIKVKMTNANSANNATLNINSTGAKALYYDGERASANNSWEAGETVEVYYDGTSFYANNVAGGSGSGDGAFDVSVKYPTSGVDGGNTYTLEGALAVLNANLSARKKKGGMSIKFIQSDNKYVQYRLMSDSWSTDTEDWVIVGEGVYVENPEFVAAYLDSEKRILFGVHTDGNFYFGAGVPKQIVDYIESKFKDVTAEDIKVSLESDTTIMQYLNETYGEYVENPEFIKVWLDNNGKMLFGVKKNGDVMFGYGIPSQIVSYISERIKEINEDISAIQAFLEGFSDTTLLRYLNETYGKYIEDPEGRHEVALDSKDKIVSYRKEDGTKVENAGIESPKITTDSLNLSESGMTDFQQALKDSGFKPEGAGNFSESMTVELPEPKGYALLNIDVDTIPINDGQTVDGVCEYYDFSGNYFKKSCAIEIQGQSGREFARTGGKGNYTIDITDGSEIKFGSWVPQDSFHLKGNAKDVTRGYLATSYKLAYKVMEYLDAKPNRVLVDESDITTTNATGVRMNDWPDDARCLSDGFPFELYINGEYWGLYSWQLKKHRKNYSMNKKDYKTFFIDADGNMTDLWNGNIMWNRFEIKNPKDLVCMDGTAYNGDAPEELIDSTSQYYDSSNKAHKGSAQTKAIIESFSTKYLEVKALVDNNDLVQAKEKFEEYFDYNACMLVYIFNCLMNNADSIEKNTLWATYNDGKIAPMLWDLDGVYGEGWVGNIINAPSASMWTRSYATSDWPLALFWTLYESEIKTTYASLRGTTITMDVWCNVIYGEWIDRIGKEAFERDLERWPDTPSYRENNINTDYWRSGHPVYGQVYPLWDADTQYQTGDVICMRLSNVTPWYMRFTAVQPSLNEPPATELYDKFPFYGGCYDSPRRMEKWMKEQIKLCDIQNDYFEELLADFIAYRITDEGYEIECTNMTIDTKLSKTYNYIQGHITRHEIEVEGQIVSTYTIDGGIEAPEDTSKTYTTVRAAIEAAASQPVDVPSENVYYINARAKNIYYHKK